MFSQLVEQQAPIAADLLGMFMVHVFLVSGFGM
jgi:hypothetical protein